MAIFVALALALAVVENLFPLAAFLPGIAPGVKLGLANIVTLTALFLLSIPEVLGVIIIRVALSAALAGGPSYFLFSVAGALLAFAAMAPLVYRAGRFVSLASVSVIGALAHNLGQLLVAALLTRTLAIVYYLPVLLTSAAATGVLVGLTTAFVLRALAKSGLIALTPRLMAFVPLRDGR
jgi:heptaprenyl diphosphate synthase